jgi:hypothetical protein
VNIKTSNLGSYIIKTLMSHSLSISQPCFWTSDAVGKQHRCVLAINVRYDSHILLIVFLHSPFILHSLCVRDSHLSESSSCDLVCRRMCLANLLAAVLRPKGDRSILSTSQINLLQWLWRTFWGRWRILVISYTRHPNFVNSNFVPLCAMTALTVRRPRS